MFSLKLIEDLERGSNIDLRVSFNSEVDDGCVIIAVTYTVI